MRGSSQPLTQFFLHKLDEFPFAHDGVREIQPGEFVLMRIAARHFERVENPIVKRPVHLKFKRTNRVRNPFDVIAERMRQIVHRINAPFVTSAMVRCVTNSIKHRISQPDVGRVHVDLCAQGTRAIWKLAELSFAKTDRDFRRPNDRESCSPSPAGDSVGLLRTHVINVRLAFANEFHCVFVKPVEIIRRIKAATPPRLFVCPAVDQPMHVRS